MKQKILLVSKFFYPRGGAEICAMNQKKMLERQGHEVAVFAMQYPGTPDTGYNRYFPKQVDFRATGLTKKWYAVSRIFHSSEVENNFIRLLENFKPDVVHLHNIHSYLSPLVAQLAWKRHIKVVWTIHDHKLICPAYSCLRKGRMCDLCFKDKKQVIFKRCMKDSLLASLLAYFEAIWWNADKLTQWVDTFICPSRYMAQKMICGGFPESKLTVMSNFLEEEKRHYFSQDNSCLKEDYYCYVGRLSPEKGIEVLLKAAVNLPYTLKIAGNGPLFEHAKKQYQSDKIKFLGHLSAREVVELVKKAKALVLPSICGDNNPLSVIEALCLGTPVIGSEIGGIPELISVPDTGRIFPAADSEKLAQMITEIYNTTYFAYQKFSTESLIRFSEETYYHKLMEIYGK